MALDNNKTDFENALEEMEGTIDALDACVDKGIMDTLKNVINEYNKKIFKDCFKVSALLKDIKLVKDFLKL
jgi:ferritin-like metal-binding protein YciE